MRRPGRQAGFTLLELLVAISLFAIMSAMAYGTLNQVLDTQFRAEEQAERLAELQKAFAIISGDLQQTVARAVRDNYADGIAAMTGGSVGTAALEFSRLGWRNPAGWSRSHVQRVSYGLDEQRLVRRNWWVLDRSTDSEPVEAVLLDGVDALEVRFMDEKRQWQEFWPGAGQEDNVDVLPLAVEVTVELQGWGRINRIYRVPGREAENE